MIIRLNGGISINGSDDIYFDNLEIEIDEDIEVPFDDIDEDYSEECAEDCDGNCYDCEYGDDDLEDDEEDDSIVEFDLDIDERFDDYSGKYKQFLSEYINKIYSSCGCPYCICEILDEFYGKALEEFA